jgi:hypothetical protein
MLEQSFVHNNLELFDQGATEQGANQGNLDNGHRLAGMDIVTVFLSPWLLCHALAISGVPSCFPPSPESCDVSHDCNAMRLACDPCYNHPSSYGTCFLQHWSSNHQPASIIDREDLDHKGHDSACICHNVWPCLSKNVAGPQGMLQPAKEGTAEQALSKRRMKTQPQALLKVLPEVLSKTILARQLLSEAVSQPKGGNHTNITQAFAEYSQWSIQHMSDVSLPPPATLASFLFFFLWQ